MSTHRDVDPATLRPLVEAAWENRELLENPEHRTAVRHTVAMVDDGTLRVATPPSSDGGEWSVNAWVKQAIVLYFVVQEMRVEEVGPFEYHDKIPLKRDWVAAGVRVVPPATARFGAFLSLIHI